MSKNASQAEPKDPENTEEIAAEPKESEVNKPPHLRAKADTKVVMQQSMAGVEFSYISGQKVKVPAEIAEAWIEAGIAAKE